MRSFSNIITNFATKLHLLVDSIEDRLHLGNTKKNEFSFGISLDLHYLCTQ